MTALTLTPASLAPVWTDAELCAQFRRCEEWNDPDQWEALGFLYLQCYSWCCMNAGYCFRRADECRALSAGYRRNQRPDDGQKVRDDGMGRLCQRS